MINLPELFSQRDNRWKSEKLGTSLMTLGTSGCLVTAMSALAKLFGKDTNPSKLNKELIQKGGYINKNAYSFYGKNISQPKGISLVYSDIIPTLYVETPNAVTTKQFAEMEAQIEKGFPVLIQVDCIPATSKLDQHWVLIIDKSNGNWNVYDPYYGDISNLNRYGIPKKTIYKYVFYEGELPEIIPEIDWAAKYHVLIEQFEQYKIIYQPYKDLIEKVSMRLRSAPKETELLQAIKEYEGYEEIASKLWGKSSDIVGKELIYPDQIETMLLEIDNYIKKQQEATPTTPKTTETPNNVKEDTRIELTTLKRFLRFLNNILSNLIINSKEGKANLPDAQEENK